MKFRFCGDLDCPDWLLAEIATLSKLSSARIKVLAVQIIHYCLSGTFNYEKVLKLASDNSDGTLNDIKGAIAAIHFILSNAAKFDVDEKSLILEVQQLGLPKENTEAIAKQYTDAKELLRRKLAEDSYRVNQLVSVDWRVDHIIASSSVDSSSGGSLINVKLDLDSRFEQHGPVHSTIAFQVTPQKLDVLISELSQAKRLMES